LLLVLAYAPVSLKACSGSGLSYTENILPVSANSATQ